MITVCILTKNAQETLPSCLESVRQFPEVLILDSGSTDATLSIAKKYSNVSIHETQFIGFGSMRNKLAALAHNDWILALDSDEVVSDNLIKEIFNLTLNENFAYSMPRNNFYRGKRIRGCGWSPDRVARLYNRNTTRYHEAMVHESLEAKNLFHLHSPLLHTPYRTTEDFLAKMQHYSTLFAKQYQGKKKSSFQKAVCHALFSFFRSYVLKYGFIDGANGLVISLYNANCAFYKYLKLNELNLTHESLDRQELHSKQEQHPRPLP